MSDDERELHRLLVVEDEEHLAAGLKLNLELEGYAVDVANTGREAGERLLRPDGYDIILLDVMLPDVDGFELCRRMRNAGNFTPVLMLTARSSPDDRVRGLEAGADDYVAKPFALEELLARVRSMLRRRRWEQAESQANGPALEFGKARIDFQSHEVYVEQEKLKLTRLELDLLRYFADNAGRVIGRDELLQRVWKLRNVGYTRTVDNFIARLRKHFEVDPTNPRHFVSVRGAGYKFVPNP